MKRKYWIILIVGVALLGAVIWYFAGSKKSKFYRESTISKDNITLKILATGTVLPENRLQIKSSVSGRAEEIKVVEGQKVKKGEVLAWISSTERAIMLDSARAQGAEEVKKWEEIYKATPILAPLNGTIILRNIEPGQTFSTSDAILVMADRLTVQAQVDETDLAKIKLQQKVQINMDSYPEKNILAKVIQIAYEAKTVNNVTTYTVYILPDEKIDFLRSGMTANVTFFGEKKENIIVVPNEFIKYEAGAPKVMVKTKAEPESRQISIGISDGKVTEVVSGLNENDVIVLEQERDAKTKSNMIFSGSTPRRTR